MPRGKKKAFRSHRVQVTMEIEVGTLEKLVHWTDPDGIGEAMDDLLEDCALIEVVCKDLGEVEDA